jgi:hypothetical protein
MPTLDCNVLSYLQLRGAKKRSFKPESKQIDGKIKTKTTSN